MQKSGCSKDTAETRKVGRTETGDLVTVCIKDAPTHAVPINRQHKFGSIARIARDVPSTEQRHILDQPSRLFKESLAANPMEPDRRACRLIASRDKKHRS